MSELNIKIRKLQDNGSTFRATPESLYMGGVGSAKVDTLCFDVPEEWKGCAITLHVQRLSGTLPDPQLLDEKNRVVVDQRWTKEKQGLWMLMAVGADGYTAMTKPGQYTCYETIDRDSTTETITPSVYEQFVALVKKETVEANRAAKNAAASAEIAKSIESTITATGEQVQREITATADQTKQAVDEKAKAALASIPEDYTALSESVGQVKENLGDLYQGNQPFAIIKDEYVNQDGTIVKTDQHWDRTDCIEINGDVTIISSSNAGFNCFFDSSKNFVSSFLLVKGENKIAVPLNAKYMICSNTSDSMMELIVKSYNNDRITELKNEAKAHEIALKSRKNLIGTIPNKLYPIDYKANENITFSTKGLVAVTKSHIFYFYDENKQYITDYALYPPHAKRTVSFDKDAKYISLKIEQEYPIQVEYGKNVTAFEPYLIEPSTCNDKIIAILGYDPSYDISWNDGGYIDRTNGTLTTYENWKYTDFIELKNTFGLIVDSDISDNTETSTYNCFYDGNKNYICNFQIASSIKRVEVPTDAKYYRLSIRTVDYCILSNAIKSISDISSMDSNSVRDDIITLNKEQEPFVIQSTATKAIGIGASLKPLTFIHFSDWHNVPALWVRICDYMNRYKDYIQFALHTGDYCAGWQGEYTDAYLLKETINPILNCVGNHDTYTKDMKENTQESAYKLLFKHTDDWNVTFGESANSMYYYKDFQESEIRLIVLDCYYDIDNQKTWLEARLNEAKDLNYAVITAMHEVSKTIIDKIQCTFQTLDNYESAGGNQSAGKFDAIIKAFKDNGGVHIVNLCGHEHDDMIGYTSNGVLNLVVECATTWNGWTGGNRIKGTKTYDCFNVFSVEKDTGVFKVVRIGDNSDHYLRAKNVLSYDYINKKVLYNA